jgi:UDP-hydrolysing UDP-N-acetyl-D-glucosamine 2-epimerase
MAHVHFATNEESAARLRQLGEDPARIHVGGRPGLDHLRRRPLLERGALEQALGAPLGKRNLLVTFHPVTLDECQGLGEFDALLQALDELPADTTLWWSRPNADDGGAEIAARLDDWAARRRASAHVFASLGQLRYLSLMAQCDAVVGNSSSGLYEAPSFGVPTVDIGDRQRGRLAADSVVRCAGTREAIGAAVASALATGRRSDVANPYGDGDSARRIVDVLRRLPSPLTLLRKSFHRTRVSHA